MATKPFLTILIPTIGRLPHLKVCLEKFMLSVAAYTGHLQVEILVADNHSQDGTSEYVLNLCQTHACLRYFRHETFRVSAEESILHAIPQCSGEYVWTFGDDDYVKTPAITEVLCYLVAENPALLFVNNDCFDGRTERRVLNFPVQHTVAIYRRGRQFFQEWGFTGGPTCVSSMCIQKKEINIPLLQEISKISTIYSLSWFLFCSFHDKKILLLGQPLFVYHFNETNSEIAGIKKLAMDRGELPNFFWNLGLIRLAGFAAGYTGIPLSQIVACNEIITAGLGEVHRCLERQLTPFTLFVASAINAELPKHFGDFYSEKTVSLLRELYVFYAELNLNTTSKSGGALLCFLDDYAKLANSVTTSKNIFVRGFLCRGVYWWYKLKHPKSLHDLVSATLRKPYGDFTNGC